MSTSAVTELLWNIECLTKYNWIPRFKKYANGTSCSILMGIGSHLQSLYVIICFPFSKIHVEMNNSFSISHTWLSQLHICIWVLVLSEKGVPP